MGCAVKILDAEIVAELQSLQSAVFEVGFFHPAIEDVTSLEHRYLSGFAFHWPTLSGHRMIVDARPTKTPSGKSEQEDRSANRVNLGVIELVPLARDGLRWHITVDCARPRTRPLFDAIATKLRDLFTVTDCAPAESAAPVKAPPPRATKVRIATRQARVAELASQMTAEEIAEELDVSVATINRDLEYLGMVSRRSK